MFDVSSIQGKLDDLGLADWAERLVPLLLSRLSSSAHGDFKRWQRTLEGLPEAPSAPARLDVDTVTVGSADLPDERIQSLKHSLLELGPWRKGPFDVCGIRIDAEWRSDLKWNRIQDHLAPLAGRAVLDVGCGNGYYMLRMRGAGAKSVLGIDPTLLYLMQYTAIEYFLTPGPVHLLPLRLHELPGQSHRFDTVFSMGVLYHQRSPIDHLEQLRDALRSGGQLVLETIFVPGQEAFACTPPGRYANMKNVWLLPTLPELETWLTRTRFRDIAIIDESLTTVDEQRPTEWMSFQSLGDALDPDDPEKTVEGWPAPRRVVVTATAP